MIFAHFSEPPEDQPEQAPEEQAEEQAEPEQATFPDRYKTGLPRRPTLDESFEREPHQGAWPGHLNGTST